MKIGIALGGGGARGIAHLGVLRVLEQEGIEPALVAGTSAGALAGALWGLLGFEASVQAVRETVERESYRKIGFEGLRQKREGLVGTIVQFMRNGYTYTRAFASRSILSARYLEETLEHLVGEATFADLPFPFYVTCLDLRKGQDIILTSGKLRDALHASCAIPGLFPPVERDGLRLVDGGATMNVPVEALLLSGADFVIAVDVGGGVEEAEGEGKALDVLLRADRISSRKLTNLLLRLADFIIRPELGELSWTDFDKVDLLVQLGMEGARKQVRQLKRELRKHTLVQKWYRRSLTRRLQLSAGKVFVGWG